MEKKKRKRLTWDEVEAELFRKGKITEEGLMIAEMKMKFSKLIYDYRIKNKLTQKQLAEKIKVRQQYIAKIEDGEENLSLETIGKLLIALKLVMHVEIREKRKLTGIFKIAA